MQQTVVPQAPSPDLAVHREAFKFNGSAREYFGIWIVNVLLTILTLGIYSAWAKVRRQRYFYGNTELAGATFEYHARPIQILIGRIVVLLLFGLYNLALQVVPIVGGLMFVAFIFVVPWLVMRGLRFSARVTSYRNVRFDFAGGYGGAFLAFVLGTALTYGTMGVLAPLASQWMWGYMLGNLRYGGRPITCDPRLEKMFGQWLMPAAVFVGGMVVLVLVAILVAVAFASTDLTEVSALADLTSPFIFVAIIYLAFIPFVLLYLVAGLLYSAGTRNVALNETVIDGRHALHSDIGRWRYAWIAASNLVVTIFTLGLARPWAAVRMARYMAFCTMLDTTGSLDAYVGSLTPEGAAVGSEFMDVEGFDVGF
jgi:uncharacterized membrane protein YjgN (DUF898 family)